MVKKLSLLILILAVYNNYLFAQTNVPDSLIMLLKAHLQADTVRVNLLTELAYNIRRLKPKASDSLAEEAFRISSTLKFNKGIGNALTLKGSYYYSTLNYKSADSAFTEAKKNLEKANDLKGQSYLLRSWANMKMDEG